MLLALALLIGGARLFGELARWLRQPAILGELIAGVLLGPTVFGWLAPDYQEYLFPRSGANAIALQGISSLAIVLFLFMAGMQVDLDIVWKQGPAAIKVSGLGTIVPFLIGLFGALLMPQALGLEGDTRLIIFALFFATAMAISALPVIVKTLMDLDLYQTNLGIVVVSAAILNDLIGWTVFALILGLMKTNTIGPEILWILIETILFTVVTLTLGRRAFQRLLGRLEVVTHSPGATVAVAVAIGLAGAAITEYIGIHAIFGAFLVGVAFSSSGTQSTNLRRSADGFVSNVLAPLFFAGIGLKVSFIANFDLRLVVFVLIVACVGKLIGGVVGARWGGFSLSESWAIGFAMNARGAMEIILGTLALEAGIIEERLFVALVVMAIATSAVSGPLIRWVLKLAK